MKISYFITGTDTEVGKTFVTVKLLQLFQKQGYESLAFKPIASGISKINDKLQNRDAFELQQASSLQLSYSEVNPFLFKEAIAPHIAAHKNGRVLSKSIIKQTLQRMLSYSANRILIEGAGGWLLPINNDTLFSEVIVELRLPIIIVVGIKLGCINHALLTRYAIQKSGGYCLGWIANIIDPKTQVIEENINFLRQKMPIPYLGRVDYQSDSIEAISSFCL